MGGGVGLGQLIKERQVRRGILWKFVASTCTKKVKGGRVEKWYEIISIILVWFLPTYLQYTSWKSWILGALSVTL